MESEIPKNNRGGKREGAGRHPNSKRKIVISARIDEDIVKMFCTEKFAQLKTTKAEYLADALRKAFKKDHLL